MVYFQSMKRRTVRSTGIKKSAIRKKSVIRMASKKQAGRSGLSKAASSARIRRNFKHVLRTLSKE